MPNEAPYGHGCPPEPVTEKPSKYRTFGPEKREAGGWAVRPGDAVHQRGQQLSGLRPRPHARRGFSLRSSLLGASGLIQPTAVIMRHAKQSAPERPFEVSIFLHRSGVRFCSKGRRITLLFGAARMPIKSKAAQPYFKANGSQSLNLSS
jgi:hypothetical protein